MALYYYSGVRGNGKKVSGFTPAHTEKEAHKNIELMAVRDYKLKRIASSLGNAEYVIFKDIGGLKVSPRSQAYFFEQVSYLLNSGFTLFQAIDILTQSSNIEIAKLTVRIKPLVVSGMSLDEALRKVGIFSQDNLAKIEAGRKSGKITKTLTILAEKIKERLELKSKVISSLTYPVFMIVMLIGVLIVMLGFIVPSIGETVKQLGGQMPLLTQIIMKMSDFVVKYGIFAAIFIVLLIGAHIYLMRNIRGYKRVIDGLIYYIPIAGKLIMKMHIQTMSSTLSQLSSSGITLSEALTITTKTLTNLKLKEAMQKVTSKVSKEGYDLYTAMESVKVFPIDYVQMVMIGSKTGNIEEILESVSKQYAIDVQESLKRITSLVEPVAILLTALVGGVCVIAMYLPMFSVFTSI